jgi:nitrous oxidase accessory protein NosD
MDSTSGVSLQAQGKVLIQIDDSLFTAADALGGGTFLPAWAIGRLVDPSGNPAVDRVANVVIQGFTFQGEGHTVGLIGLHAVEDCRITGNTFTGQTSGINIHSDAVRVEIDHNVMTGTADIRSDAADVNGVISINDGLTTNPAVRRPCTDMSIHHNQISGFTRGLQLRGFEGGSVDHNQCDRNIIGLLMQGAIGLAISDNHACDNGPDVPGASGTVKAAGIALQNATNTTVSKNHAERNARGFLMRIDTPFYTDRGYPLSSGVVVSNNHFVQSTLDNSDLVPEPPPAGVVYDHNH